VSRIDASSHAPTGVCGIDVAKEPSPAGCRSLMRAIPSVQDFSSVGCVLGQLSFDGDAG